MLSGSSHYTNAKVAFGVMYESFRSGWTRILKVGNYIPNSLF